MTFISYAQNFEDIMLWRALKHVRNGFYIDIGANDPEVDSVTFAFYERGWRGINVEPMRQYYERLRIKRPADVNLPCAVGEAPGELTFYDVPGTGLSTVDQTVGEQHASAGHTVNRQSVPVTTLAAICAEHVEGPIHFLKIDVEGFEQAVLRGMDFQRWRPWVLLIEATRPQSEETNYEEWEDLVLETGYQFAYFDGLNRYYVAREHGELLSSFDTPPNFFDHFQLREDHAFSHPLGPLKEKIAFAERRALDAQAAADHARTQLGQIHAQVQGQLHQAETRIQDALSQARTATAQHEQARRHLQQVQEELQLARHQISAIYASTSWRITRPIRQMKTALRNPRLVLGMIRSLLGRVKAMIRKAVVKVLKRVAAQPQVRALAGRILLRFPSMRERLKEMAARMSALPAAQPAARIDDTYTAVDLSTSGRRAFSDLQRAINKNE